MQGRRTSDHRHADRTQDAGTGSARQKLLDMWPQMSQATRRRVCREDPRREIRTGSPTRRSPAPKSARWCCRATRTTAKSSSGGKENVPGSFRSRRACSPSSARTRTRCACSPARAMLSHQPPLQEGQRGHARQRLSTAFDSVTLSRQRPGDSPDIYGKVGNSGVSIATSRHEGALSTASTSARPTRPSR